MSLLTMLLILWAGLTTILVVLLIYRSTLSMQEDDQLFLDQAESHMEQAQSALMKRINRLQLPVRLLGTVSGLLILFIFGMWIWQGLNQR